MSWTTCSDCEVYAARRMPVVHPEVLRIEESTGEHRALILGRFMRGVHRRHMSGLPIIPEQQEVS